MMLSESRKTKIVFVMLILGVVAQLWVGGSVLVNNAKDSWNDLDRHALWRGAKIFRSANFADYIAFLNENIPFNAIVILPPDGELPNSATDVPTMQFLLISRDIRACPEKYNQCIESYSQTDAYILVLGKKTETISQMNISPDRILMHNSALGIIKPQFESGESPTPLIKFNNRFEILPLLILPFLFLLVITWIGSTISAYFYPGGNWFLSISLGYMLGTGVFSLSLYAIMLFGVAMSSSLVWTNLLLWSAMGLYINRLTKQNNDTNRDLKTKIDVWHIIIGLYAFIIIFISIGKGYSFADDIFVWGAKGYGIATDGLIEGVSNWGTKTTRYPLNTPIWIAIFKTWFSEAVPQSKLLFSLMPIMLYVFIYESLKEKLPISIAGSFTLLISTIPLIFRHSTLAFANLFVSAYFTAAIIISWKSVDIDDDVKRYKLLGLGSLLFVLAGWTRPETTVINIPIIFYISLVFQRRFPPNKKLKMTAVYVLPYLSFFVFWTFTASYIYNDRLLSDGLYSKVLENLISGNYRIDAVLVILKELFRKSIDPSVWGVWGVLFVVAVGYNLLRKRHLTIDNLILFGAGSLYILLVIGMYYTTAFYDKPSINWWVETGLYRMIMPGYLVIGIGGLHSVFRTD